MVNPISQHVQCGECGQVGCLEITDAVIASGLGEKPRKIKFAYKCLNDFRKSFQVFSEDQLPYSEKLYWENISR